MDYLKVIPLGGCGEIGLNMIVLETENDMIVIDCGAMFPEDYMLGVDFVIPDVSYVKSRKDKLRAIFVTHGHEDHTGGIPFLLKDVQAPVFGTKLTLGLLSAKLAEHGLLERVELISKKRGDVVKVGDFELEFISVCHSISDGVGFGIKTPVGIVVHTGDFKFDHTPVDGILTDMNRFSYYGSLGVLVLLSDSTNVEKEGYTYSESCVGKILDDLFRVHRGRIFVALFSSNIPRIQQVVNSCKRFGRKLFVSGKSLVTNIRIAKELGYLEIPHNMMEELHHINYYPKDKICVVTTGSQGEPNSTLSRLAINRHKQLEIEEGDLVVISSKFIPGNEKTIANLINHLYRRGAEVVYEKTSEIHVSGHASQEELKMMINICKPKYFIPIHGEFRHLVKHIQLAESLRMKKEHLILAEDRDTIVFYKDGTFKREGKVEGGRIYVDGKGVGDIGNAVLQDRRHLGEDGMVIVVTAIDKATGEILSEPDVVSRGFVPDGGSPIMVEAKDVVKQTLEEINLTAKTDWVEVKSEVRRALRKFFTKTLERRPIIIPIIMEL